jgi:two-component system, chemotaxis family, chemotaxis protein CheY
MDAMTAEVKALMQDIKVLIVDDEHYTRKVIRTLLLAIGCVKIHEAHDGPSGLEMIRSIAPDVVLLDWQMPGMDGTKFVRMVRQPNSFPFPNVPIIMLTGHGERSRVLEAVRLGVHEFLLKPVSSGALLARLLSVLTKPRAMVRRGDYYGPEPRKLSTYKPEADSYKLEAGADAPAAVASPPPAADKPAARVIGRSSAHVIFVN